MKVKDILTKKGSQVITISKNTTVLEAISIFSTNRVGSLLVVDKNDGILGIVAASQHYQVEGNFTLGRRWIYARSEVCLFVAAYK